MALQVVNRKSSEESSDCQDFRCHYLFEGVDKNNLTHGMSWLYYFGYQYFLSLLHYAFSMEKFTQNRPIMINLKNVQKSSLLKCSLQIVHNTDFK